MCRCSSGAIVPVYGTCPSPSTTGYFRITAKRTPSGRRRRSPSRTPTGGRGGHRDGPVSEHRVPDDLGRTTPCRVGAAEALHGRAPFECEHRLNSNRQPLSLAPDRPRPGQPARTVMRIVFRTARPLSARSTTVWSPTAADVGAPTMRGVAATHRRPAREPVDARLDLRVRAVGVDLHGGRATGGQGDRVRRGDLRCLLDLDLGLVNRGLSCVGAGGELARHRVVARVEQALTGVHVF